MENKVENYIPEFKAEVNFDEMDYLDESDFNNSKYVYGCGVSKDGKTMYQEDGSQYAIIQGTASIHFPDMIASDSDRLLPNGEKDLRIFASLQEDGKGGDRGTYTDESEDCPFTYVYQDGLRIRYDEWDRTLANTRIKPTGEKWIKMTGIK